MIRFLVSANDPKQTFISSGQELTLSLVRSASSRRLASVLLQ
jgi:hypothetical protein